MPPDSSRRSRLWRVWVAAAVILFLTPAANGRSLAESLTKCLERAQGSTESVLAVCPGVQDQIAESELGPFLPSDWSESLTRDQLSDLLILSGKTASAADSTYRLDTVSLQGILRELEAEVQTEVLSPWDRFVRWLRGVLDRQNEQVGPAWFDELLKKMSVSDRVGRIIYYGSILVIVLIAVGVVLNELRAAGRRKAGVRTAKQPHAADAPGSGAATGMGVFDLDRIPYRQRPVALLKQVIERLRQRELLPRDSSLTSRELEQHLSRTLEPYAPSFQRIRVFAEGVSFGDWDPPPSRVDALVSDSRDFLSELDRREEEHGA